MPSREAPRLLLATNNAGKSREFQALLSDSGWEAVTPASLELELEVSETGSTYEDNARLKATAFARASGLPALADDSGLEVDALGGEPGPLHHLRGWDGRDDSERISILLDSLRSVPAANRRCRYKAVVLVAFPDGSELVGEGACEGVIVDRSSGAGGFGYDPVFFLPDFGRTMAELTFDEKNAISHRARAASQILPALRQRAGVPAD